MMIGIVRWTKYSSILVMLLLLAQQLGRVRQLVRNVHRRGGLLEGRPDQHME